MFKRALFSFFIFKASFSLAQEVVQVQSTIILNTDQEKACTYVSNPLNDHHWRKEVNSIIRVDGQYIEDAWIGIRKNFITITELIDSNCPNFSTFITTKENPYYLRSHRSFQYIDDNKTEFTYTVDFDVKMIKETFGFQAKPSVVKELYLILMRSYMRKLKSLSFSWNTSLRP